jgi:hypothetical protein
MAKVRVESTPHSVPLIVRENVPSKMYLQDYVGSGDIGGLKCDVGRAGALVVFGIGGRQFTLDVQETLTSLHEQFFK